MNAPARIVMDLENYLPWEAAQREKHELVRGEPVLRRLRMMAGGTKAHARIAGNLCAAINARLPRGGPCSALGSDFKVRSPTGNARYPDVTVECGPSGPQDLIAAEPGVVIEVLSPSNDAFGKLELLEDYQAITTLAHIVFIDQDSRRAQIWNRDGAAWKRTPLEQEDASLDLSSISATIPFAEIYEGVVFEAEAAPE